MRSLSAISLCMFVLNVTALLPVDVMKDDDDKITTAQDGKRGSAV